MSLELNYLFFAVLLTFVQMLITAAAANQQVGLSLLAGNRESMPELSGFAGRAKRAHLNMTENLVLFAALVLVATAANKLNAMTALGATIFFWSRLVYAVVYLLGITWLRTGIWFVSVIGMGIIASQLI